VEIEALRILQEAMTNAYKHANATHLEIYFQRQNGYVELSVQDNGKGFDPLMQVHNGHYGLHIMQERAERVAGSFYLASAPNRGTQIIVRLPADKTGEPEVDAAQPLLQEAAL